VGIEYWGTPSGIVEDSFFMVRLVALGGTSFVLMEIIAEQKSLRAFMVCPLGGNDWVGAPSLPMGVFSGVDFLHVSPVVFFRPSFQSISIRIVFHLAVADCWGMGIPVVSQ
jgi:hypothetical protein